MVPPLVSKNVTGNAQIANNEENHVRLEMNTFKMQLNSSRIHNLSSK